MRVTSSTHDASLTRCLLCAEETAELYKRTDEVSMLLRSLISVVPSEREFQRKHFGIYSISYQGTSFIHPLINLEC